MAGKPDRLLTHNTKHFTNAVAQRTSGRIATPAEFFSGAVGVIPVETNAAKPIGRSADTVVCKEKQLVLDDGSAHIATELLALELPTANINTSNANAIDKID